MKESLPLTAILEERSGRVARLRLNDNQELTVPSHLLPKQSTAGDVIYLRFLTKAQLEASQTELAQAILEELLNNK